MGIKKIIFIFLLILASGQNFAQEGVSKDIREINGERFYFHTVEKGNTLYSISKLYNVDLKEIIKYNPEAKEGLRIDQVLKVPFKKAKLGRVEKNDLRVDGSFLIHRVVKGETLYGISKRYNIAQENILKYNPFLAKGIKPGMELKIETLVSKPKDDQEESLESLNRPAKVDSFINHVVEPKETWYGIANKYQVSIDSLMAFNPKFAAGIKIGDVLRIPRLSPQYLRVQLRSEIDTTATSLRSDSNVTEVMLFLPFYLEENDTSFITKVEDGLTYKNDIIAKSRLAFEFYEGVLLALDSLTKSDFKVRLMVFDTKSSVGIDALLDTLNMSRTDLIIGPLYRSNFDKVLKKAKPYGIPMISPVPQSNKILLDNPNVIKMAPSYASEVAFIRDYYDNKLKGTNFYLVNSNTFKDYPLVNVFWNEGTGPDGFDSSMMINISEPERADIRSRLDTNGNYFYIPSSDKGYVGRFVNMMYPYSRDYPITVIGMSNWADYDNLDIDYLQQMNLHYTTEFFADYDDPDVIDLLRSYRNRFGTEPLKYGFLGYEIMLNFIDFNTSNMLEDLETINSSGMVLKFDFRKFDFSNGIENRGLFLIRISGFSKERVR